MSTRKADDAEVLRFLEKYLPGRYEYPDGPTLIRGLQDGVLFEYVSGDYLNGLVNYVAPLKAFVVNRYREDGLPSEAFAAALAKIEVHANLSVFQDDVLLLARIEEQSFAYFWFARHVRDCEVGAFAVEDEAEVLRDFEAFAQAQSRVFGELNGRPPRCYEIPREKLCGWISG